MELRDIEYFAVIAEHGHLGRAADALGDWWHDTPPPGADLHDPARFLGRVTERLLQRAATILAAPPTTHALSPHLHGAISALRTSDGRR